MPSSTQVALNFLALQSQDFQFRVYRRQLDDDENSPPGTRWLPVNLQNTGDNEAKRFEVSLQPKHGFDEVTVGAWLCPPLTVEAIHHALVTKINDAITKGDVEFPNNDFKREAAFVLKRHNSHVREVMWLRAHEMKAIRKFGFLCSFKVRVAPEATITPRQRLELSLTHRNGRVNEAFYLDRYQKIGDFLQLFHSKIKDLTLHDGTAIEIDGRLSVFPSFTLDTRTYVFSGEKEAKKQFFGLRDLGPYSLADKDAKLAFLFRPEDKASSQDLFKALRGDTFTTFSGMEKMFRTSIGKGNVTGIEVAGFDAQSIQSACDTLRAQHPNEHILPIALVPYSKHTSEQMTADYYRSKHAFLQQRFASQFIDRLKTMGDKNALKWSISNIGLATFAKMGGTPWKIKPSTRNCLIVGIGQAHVINDDKVEKYVAYSVLTDSSGTYETIRVLANTKDKAAYLEKLKSNLREVLLSHQNTYSSFVLHVTFSLRRDEIEAIKSLLTDLEKVPNANREFVVIKFNDHNDYFGFSTQHNSRVPFEGTVTPLSKKEFVMWFSGVGAADSKAPNKPERPVHLKVLYPESPLPLADLQRLIQDAINIAGANWRGFNAKSMPISVYYAKLIADYYAQFRLAGLEDVDMDNLPPWFL